MKRAVILGAGSVGRGFIGQLFSESGWEVTFVDVDPVLVEALAHDGFYPHVTVNNAESIRTVVGPVTAIDSRQVDAVVAALVEADAAATAVGARVLPRVLPMIARAVERRIKLGRPPLNVLLCENLHGAGGIARAIVAEELPHLPADALDESLGLLETSIGRMIPAPNPVLLADEPTIIQAEPYRQLPYDVAAVRGAPLEVSGLVGDRSVPFAFYGDRKLYVHNMGHALTAYLGDRAGSTLVWQAIAMPDLRYLVRAAMVESAVALALSYSRPLAPLLDHVDDLIHRFGNRALGDSVERVGRDPIRKTAAGDRLVGAYLAAIRQQVPTRHLSLAVAAGADALHRREGWSDQQIRDHLNTAMDWAELSAGNRQLLEAQIVALALPTPLDRQIDLIDSTFEPARVL